MPIGASVLKKESVAVKRNQKFSPRISQTVRLAHFVFPFLTQVRFLDFFDLFFSLPPIASIFGPSIFVGGFSDPGGSDLSSPAPSLHSKGENQQWISKEFFQNPSILSKSK